MMASAYVDPAVPYRTLNGIQTENQFTMIDPVARISGLLAPNQAGPNIEESVRADIFVVIGSPTQVLSALQNMNQNEGWNW